jgi:hypothetical protein
MWDEMKDGHQGVFGDIGSLVDGDWKVALRASDRDMV